ncbi:MAG: hypothetical protein ACW98U_04575 [Candidatus Thorarchaeota archaeon]
MDYFITSKLPIINILYVLAFAVWRKKEGKERVLFTLGIFLIFLTLVILIITTRSIPPIPLQ